MHIRRLPRERRGGGTTNPRAARIITALQLLYHGLFIYTTQEFIRNTEIFAFYSFGLQIDKIGCIRRLPRKGASRMQPLKIEQLFFIAKLDLAPVIKQGAVAKLQGTEGSQTYRGADCDHDRNLV